MTDQMTAEEYRVRVLRARFAERVSEYEDQIATLITQNAQLQQELDALREQNAPDEAEN